MRASVDMLLYTKELVAPATRLRPGLQRFKRHPLREKYGRKLRSFFAHSTIHGIPNVVEEHHLWVRYFWILVILISSLCFLTISSYLQQRQQQQLLVTVVETTQLPVFNIEFPAVAICPMSHINWIRADTAAERFLPSDADQSVRNNFQRLLRAMEFMTFGKFEPLGTLTLYNLSGLVQLNLQKLSNYMSYRCDELFVSHSCMFDETPFDCCQFFMPEHTDRGQCLVFNSLISDDSRKMKLVNSLYPYKLSTAGEGSGLSFIIYLNRSVLLANNPEAELKVTLILKEQHQWSNSIVHDLQANTETFVSVDPFLIRPSSTTLQMTPATRRCYLKNEHHPNYSACHLTLPYSRSNCIACCLQWYVLQYCMCTMPQYLPVIEGTRACGVLDLECLYSNTDLFNNPQYREQDRYVKNARRGLYCSCPDSCNTRQFNALLNVRQWINTSDKPYLQAPDRIWAEVAYGQRVMTRVKTKLKYTFYDLLASFGGILGLFIGASMLSFAELAYVLSKILWSLLKDVHLKIKCKLSTKG